MNILSVDSEMRRVVNDFYALIRFGLPGSVFLFVVSLPDLLSVALNADHRSMFMESFPSFQPSLISGVAALVTLAVIPLGYLIYQVYFFMYWVLPQSTLLMKFFPKWVRRLPQRKIPLQTARLTSVAPELHRYDSSFHNQWFAVEVGWYECLSSEKNQSVMQALNSRASRLFDIYHSLGAVAKAIELGGLIIMAETLRYALPGSNLQPLMLQWVVWLPVVGILLTTHAIVNGTRRYTCKNVVIYQNGVLRFLEKRSK